MKKTLEELYNDVAALPTTSEVKGLPFGFELLAEMASELTRSMDWLVVTTDESGESRYPCYYADSALTIYDWYKPERIYQRTGKRAVARLVHKGVTIAIKHANDTGYISRVMREGYGLKY